MFRIHLGSPLILKPRYCECCDLIDVLIGIIKITAVLKGEISVTYTYSILPVKSF